MPEKTASEHIITDCLQNILLWIVCVYTLRPNQQTFSHIDRTISCPPGLKLNLYFKAAYKACCSRTQHSDSS